MKAMVQNSFPKWTEKYVELGHECINEESPWDGTPRVASNESHQKSEANQHHDIYILEGRVSRVVQISAGTKIDPDEYPDKSNQDDLNCDHDYSEYSERLVSNMSILI